MVDVVVRGNYARACIESGGGRGGGGRGGGGRGPHFYVRKLALRPIPVLAFALLEETTGMHMWLVAGGGLAAAAGKLLAKK